MIDSNKIASEQNINRLICRNNSVIDLSDIESELLKHEAVKDCEVTYQNEQIYIYYVKSELISDYQLNEYLKKCLPSFYFPLRYIQVQIIPRNNEGDISLDFINDVKNFDSFERNQIESRFRGKLVDDCTIVLEYKKQQEYISIDNEIYKNNIDDDSSDESQESQLPAIIQTEEMAIEEQDPHNLTELFINALESNKGIIYVDKEGIEKSENYKDLYTRAAKVAAGLIECGCKAGDEVIFQFTKNEDYIGTFWGCVLAGLIPVPLNTALDYKQLNSDTEKLLRVYELLDNPIIVCSDNIYDDICVLKDLHADKNLKVVSILSLQKNEPIQAVHHAKGEDLALILFTSGSTGVPKGVMLTHNNIILRSKGSQKMNSFNENEMSINWMPLEHGGGIIYFHIRDIYLKCSQIHIRKDIIIKNPLLWLDLIDKYKATVTWAPNFAFSIINSYEKEINEGNWDLSSMKYVLNGGEAVSPKTAKKFVKILMKHGLPANSMKPVYGMTETSSGCIYSHSFDIEKVCDDDKFVSIGRSIPGVSLRIADDNNNIKKEGQIGRFQIYGTTITKGYYKAPEITKESFTPDNWLDTGDLGFIKDGELTLTGRAKDIIIINSINYYCQEIEAVVEELDGIVPSFCAACSINEKKADTDKSAVFYSLVTFNNRKIEDYIAENKEDILRIQGEIREKIFKRCGLLADYIIPLLPEEFPKTDLGKIQRPKLKQQFEKGEFNKRLELLEDDFSTDNKIPNWFYEKEWVECRLPKSHISIENNTVMIIAPEGIEYLSDELEKAGLKVITVKGGNGFNKISETIYEVRHEEISDYGKLFESFEKSQLSLDYIINFTENSDAVDENELLKLTKRIKNPINAYNAGKHIKYYVITKNAFVVDKEDKFVFQNGIIQGLVKSIGLERLEIKAAQIDVIDGEDIVSIVKNELKNPRNDHDIAYRGSKRFIPKFKTAEKSKNNFYENLTANGLVLVTGGLGGIGTTLCEWLLKEMNTCVLIIGRTDLENDDSQNSILKRNKLKELEQISNRVKYKAIDVTDFRSIKNEVDEMEKAWNAKLTAIFHLAGSLGIPDTKETVTEEIEKHTVIQEKDQSYIDVYRSKILGTIALNQLREGNKNISFVVFSTLYSHFGGISLGAYSSANSFLEPYCALLEKDYPLTYSIHWGMWDQTGISAKVPQSVKITMERNGYYSLNKEQGLNSLKHILYQGTNNCYVGINADSIVMQSAILNGLTPNIDMFFTKKCEGQSLCNTMDLNLIKEELKNYIIEKTGTTGCKINSYRMEVIPRLSEHVEDVDLCELINTIEKNNHNKESNSKYQKPRNSIEEKLVLIWQELFETRKEISINDNFFKLGGHSLKVITLSSRINKEFNIDMPLEEIFNNPTIEGIAEYIQGGKEAKYSPIIEVAESLFYPASSAQKRLYSILQRKGSGLVYNTPFALIIDGNVDIKRLEDSFKTLMHRHESLRTSFKIIDNEIVQEIEKAPEFKINIMDMDEEDIDNVICNVVKPFELDKAPLFRVFSGKISQGKQLLLVDFHHIIVDGVSVRILFDELKVIYEGGSLTPLKIQYKDYSVWEKDLISSGVLKQHENYWNNLFQDEIPVLNLPLDYKRPMYQSFEGDCIYFDIDKELTKQLKQLCVDTDSTIYMVLLAAYNILLSKYTGQEDIVVSSPAAGRIHSDIQNMVGMFVNILPQRNYPLGSKKFTDFLQEIKNNSLKTFEHQDYPFELLVNKFNFMKEFNRNPLLDAIFVLQNADEVGIFEDIQIGEFKISQYNVKIRYSRSDIALMATDKNETLSFYIEYSKELFEKETINRIMQHYINILKGIVASPHNNIDSFNMLTKAEKDQVLFDFNNTKKEISGICSIKSLFESQANRYPDKTAVIFDGKKISYQELNKKSNQVAAYLREKGIKPNDTVAIMMEVSFELIIGLLGIIKSGGAYIPIDPTYPEERINYILNDSKIKFVISQDRFSNQINDSAEFINIYDSKIYTCSDSDLDEVNSDEDLVYIIYTSGTTGKPKGVMIGHQSLANLVTWRINEYGYNGDDVTLQVLSVAFDGFGTNFYCSLLSGGSLVLMKDSQKANLPGIIKENAVTNISLTPSLYKMIVEEADQTDLASLRFVVLAGEKTDPDIINTSNKKNPEIEIINEYGPTEGTITTTYFKGLTTENTTVIGKPINNVETYVLGKSHDVLAIGVVGELFIAGMGLAKGYVNNEILNQEKFIPNIFDKNQKMYKTGDLVRWLPDGNLEFMGRVDRQVKINGYRVELGEIENTLLKNSKIKSAIVVANNQNNLWGYYVTDYSMNENDVRQFLTYYLPEYMIPNRLMRITEIPLTEHGKIDYKKLPEPQMDIKTSEEPINELEILLQKIWSEVLNVNEIGVNDNFFDRGGESIKNIQIISRLQKFGYILNNEDIYDHPTIRELSKKLKVADVEIIQAPVEGRVELSPVQKWFFETNNCPNYFNQSALIFNKFGIDEERLKKVFQRIIEHHDALRIVFNFRNNTIEQYNKEIYDGAFELIKVDIRDDEDCELRIANESKKIQSSFNISTGPLVKLLLFKTQYGDYLRIIIHHLVVDGVSWRIILEDLMDGYEQLTKNNEIKYQEKTNSFKEWTNEIYKYAESPELKSEEAYWEEILKTEIPVIKKDAITEKSYFKDVEIEKSILTKAKTKQLVEESNKAFRTEINDLLLTALIMAFNDWKGIDELKVNLESHGRENVIKGFNISRTVGWFTNQYPIILRTAQNNSIPENIKITKESLRAIPNKGFGFGVLKYISERSVVRDVVSKLDINFNYLGKFNELKDNDFELIQFLSNDDIYPEMIRENSIDITAVIINEEMVFSFYYNKNEFLPESIKELANCYQRNLIEITDCCNNSQLNDVQLSDFEQDISQEELDNIMGLFNNK